MAHSVLWGCGRVAVVDHNANDEIWTVDSHVRQPRGDTMREHSMNHHCFFSMKAKLSAQLFGEDPWAYRFPALVFGVGTVVAIWWLVRGVENTRVAHNSALLVALSHHQVRFSQKARGYTERAFWSVLGLILSLRGVRRPTYGTWIVFGLTVAAAVFTHLTGAFFFVALGLVWLVSLATGINRDALTRARVLRPLFGVAVALALTILAYLPIFQSHFRADWGTIDTAADHGATMSQPGSVTSVVLFPNRVFRAVPQLNRDTQARLELVREFPETSGDGAVLVFRRPWPDSAVHDTCARAGLCAIRNPDPDRPCDRNGSAPRTRYNRPRWPRSRPPCPR
ncbi:Dolichyl-phosphate-mannose-protein mannosyltransferase [Ruegeria intermedia]|uniref:Dolichyl-phosphate-mannose-protein mannosyltransferase n=1 Tax=Ruegeria intermedia TaxID=996115 RepID=A0A1M4Z543_9RHOB|nr:glycosyltransferase family 39 protein [Ruegeria intermedia]SHF13203.1 Dolichyl-phosphate-mannose-protein mannosyltransferase [Ruegeria intermedia]